VSRIDFGEVFMIKACLKEVWKPKKDLQIDSNRSNPTVRAKVCPQNVFKHDSEQNWGRIQDKQGFQKNQINSNTTKCFILSRIPFGMLEQHGGNIGQVPQESI